MKNNVHLLKIKINLLYFTFHHKYTVPNQVYLQYNQMGRRSNPSDWEVSLELRGKSIRIYYSGRSIGGGVIERQVGRVAFSTIESIDNRNNRNRIR